MTRAQHTEERRTRFGLYLYYLASTLSFRTYRNWKKAGQPNPFLQRKARRDETTRHDIAETFRDEFKGRSESYLVAPSTEGSRQH